MVTQNQYHALLVEPNSAQRAKFRQVALGSRALKELYCVPDLATALTTLEKGMSVNLVFVSGELYEHDLKDFLKTSRLLPNAARASFVVVGQGIGRESWRIASNVLHGADGFLFEPYSVQSFVSAAETANAAKHDTAHARERAAIKLLVRSIVEQLTDAATLMAQGHAARLTQKMLHEMCTVLSELTEAQRFCYYEELAMACEAAPAMQRLERQRGSSPQLSPAVKVSRRVS